MKKLLALLMVLCLLLPMAALADGENSNVVYASDFTADTDGWYARSNGSAQLTVVPDGLQITGREGSWNSPGRSFDLTPGTTYWFKLDVKQSGAITANLMLSVAHKTGDEETYEVLRCTAVPRDEWTTMYASWTAGSYDSYVLYVETSGSPKLDYTIRNFQVLLSDPLIPANVNYEGELPRLRELYADKFDFGCCASRTSAQNLRLMDFVATQFSIVTPENELKPDSVLDVSASRKLAQDDDTAVAVHFDAVKPLMNYAQRYGLKVHGHVMVWHSQTPEAFFHVGYDIKQPFVTREVMLARLDNYIRQIFEYMDATYPGVIVSWDVANECIADGTGKMRESNWTKVVGNDFVNRAFEIADKYAPDDVLLCYNDYSTPYEPKLTGIYNLLKSLVADGHIDCYGFQSHYSSGDPSVASVRKAFEKISSLGLRLRVSEMDIAINTRTDATLAAQAKRYAELMALYVEYADILEAVQVWGITDSSSWISTKNPLLFDGRQQPKPAFWALVPDVNQ